MAARPGLWGGLALCALAAGGCYERAWFYPAPGHGTLVTNGRGLGAATSLHEGAGGPGSPSFVTLSVEEAYTSGAGGGMRRTIVHATANVVNRGASPVLFRAGETALEAAGAKFAPKWIALWPAARRPGDSVPPGTRARFDLYFDLGAYVPSPGAAVRPPGGAGGGVPLQSLKEFTVSWKAERAGEPTEGSHRFVRDYTGTVGAGWRAAPGPYWGCGWWRWPYAWPTGIVVRVPVYPWRPGPLGPPLRPVKKKLRPPKF